MVVITQVHPIAVVFSLPQDYLQNITAAMKRGPLKVITYSRDNLTKLADGTLLLIDNQIDAATGTLRLYQNLSSADRSRLILFVDVHYSFIRYRSLSLPAGQFPATGRLSDHWGHLDISRREPRNHGVCDRHTIGAAVWPDSERDPDDLIERAWAYLYRNSSSISTETLMAPRRMSKPLSMQRLVRCRRIFRLHRHSASSIQRMRRS
jgi:hypothetical protein